MKASRVSQVNFGCSGKTYGELKELRKELGESSENLGYKEI